MYRSTHYVLFGTANIDRSTLIGKHFCRAMSHWRHPLRETINLETAANAQERQHQ
ncbi:hypothetical protein GWL_27910 [Herbaspirillum sp. GW103]|nr:hypothetical protein GWL_27910 [Herbaspirillum sp. GW103]